MGGKGRRGRDDRGGSKEGGEGLVEVSGGVAHLWGPIERYATPRSPLMVVDSMRLEHGIDGKTVQ